MKEPVGIFLQIQRYKLVLKNRKLVGATLGRHFDNPERVRLLALLRGERLAVYIDL